MIEAGDIRARYRQAAKFLDERGRRLFAANEALGGTGGLEALHRALPPPQRLVAKLGLASDAE